MAIEPINGAYFRPDLTTSRRQDQQAGPGATSTVEQRPNLQLQQVMQAGRETSALLSTLPGPNRSFFQPPAPPPGISAQGPAGRGPAGTQRLNAPLLETMQTGRETSALLSALMGPNQRAFQAPTPPAFAAPQNQAGLQANAAGSAGAAGPLAAGPITSGNLPRAGAPFLETEQAGRVTSALLSSLTNPGRPGESAGLNTFAQPAGGVASDDPMATLRTAQEVIQAVGTASPSSLNMRIANDAYQMEAQAQRAMENQQTPRRTGSWEWFA